MAWPAPVSIATPAPRAGSGRFQTVGSLWAVRIPSSLFAVPLGASCAVTNRDIVGLADASRADGAQTSAAVRRSAKTPGPPLPVALADTFDTAPSGATSGPPPARRHGFGVDPKKDRRRTPPVSTRRFLPVDGLPGSPRCRRLPTAPEESARWQRRREARGSRLPRSSIE